MPGREERDHRKRKEGGEGVDEQASKDRLYYVARRLDIEGRSHMSKGELLDAIRAENRRRTR